MRITFCLPNSTLSGGTRVVLIYVRALVARGHDVFVVTQTPRTPGRRGQLRGMLKRALGKGKPATTPTYDPFAFLGDRHIQADRRSADFKDHLPDADVVIATWWETAFSVMALPPEKGRKVYFVQHHEVHDHLPRHLSAGSYHLPMQKITIAGWLRDVMADTYGDHDVPVVPNAVDFEQFSAPPRGRGTPLRVGFLHSRTAYKGGDVARAAIEIARQSQPDLAVTAFGTPEATAGAGLPEGTEYHQTPPQERLRDIYAKCDVWLMPSHTEGFGLPVLEAMACRTPVISTRTGVGPDVIRPGENGYLVDIGDARAMAAHLLEMAAMANHDWQAMSEAAYATATAYSWDTAADLFEAALLQTPPPAAPLREVAP